MAKQVIGELAHHIHGDVLSKDNRLALVQVGWLGQTGQVYGYHEDPRKTEGGGYSPLYIAVGQFDEEGLIED